MAQRVESRYLSLICVAAVLGVLCLWGCSEYAAPTKSAAAAEPVDDSPDSGTTTANTEPKSLERVTFHAPPKPLPDGAVTHDWTQFLGPTRNAVSSETKIQKRWPETGPKLVWEMEVGNGYSSPSISKDRLVYPHRIGNEVIVECLHPETGKSYWQFRFPSRYQDRYGYSNGPRASPVIDGERVYIYSAEGRLFCLELASGEVVWERNIATEFDVPQDFFGTAQSPLLEGDLLIVNVGAPKGPCVAAFDKRTGKTRWQSGENGWGPSYASPVPATIHGKRRVFVFAGGDSNPPTGGLLSLDPKDGSIDWEFPWRSTKYESVNASCPVVVGDQVFISATYQTGSALLKIAPDMSKKTLWTTKEVDLHWNTAVHKDGYLYAFAGRNEPDAHLVCVELKSGKVIWSEVPEWDEAVTYNGQTQELTLSTYRASLLYVDGRFLCLGELGHLMWLDLSPEGYKELQRHRLFFARQTWQLPVLSHGLLYVSQNLKDPLAGTPPRLLCYDLRTR